MADREDAWVVVPSPASRPGCYSFESVRKPGLPPQRLAPTVKDVYARTDYTFPLHGGVPGEAQPSAWPPGGSSLHWRPDRCSGPSR
ncbi:hypothetical protein ABZ557_17580 [Streptomyces sp. NPDC019645]|uniref:hypothetical protein n=1 Tax=Streptomyces sp. NPDC019645 TaxID=3154786 RepID=UPI00341098E8